jgi:hypothetical protein
VSEALAAEDDGEERAYDLGHALAHSSPAEWFGTEWLHLEKADYDYMIRCVRHLALFVRGRHSIGPFEGTVSLSSEPVNSCLSNCDRNNAARQLM